ncbi:hypothetical protein EVAR_54902_1 [Eumeta japonica]|uniref:Uncharacterized protein n=1 Tax=Eumeta variegata TaxID=151549 RepID=A0A4C1Z2N6_EUMVA|nr:hypothetical protein EVAR_54902_1 [Eumeta japonica]
MLWSTRLQHVQHVTGWQIELMNELKPVPAGIESRRICHSICTQKEPFKKLSPPGTRAQNEGELLGTTLQRLTYEPLEDADQEIIQKSAGPHVYTNGSKIEGKVGATFTWWEKGKELISLTFSVDLYGLPIGIVTAAQSNITGKVQNRAESRSVPHQEGLTGYGGIVSYLHRFCLKDDPGCEWNAEVEETVWHVLPECPCFLAAHRYLGKQVQNSSDKKQDDPAHLGGKNHPFSQARLLLSRLRVASLGEAISSRTISVDAMSVSLETVEVANRLGCIKASEVHEQRIAEDKIAMLEENKQRVEKEKSKFQEHIHVFMEVLERAAKSLPGVKERQPSRCRVMTTGFMAGISTIIVENTL